MEKLLTPKELGQMLGLSTQTIYNRRSQGLPLPCTVKWGRLLRFREQDVVAWIAAQSENIMPQTLIQKHRGRPTKAEQVGRRIKN